MTDTDATGLDLEAWKREDPPRSVPGTGQLAFLIDDAAARAAAMLAGDTPTPGNPRSAGALGPTGNGGGAALSGTATDPLVDAVRMLATPGGAAYAQAAAERTGMGADELRRLVLAHTRGGAGAVAAAAGPTECGEAEMEAAVAEIRRRRALAVGDLEVVPGSVTDPGAGIRVRLGPDARWHPFTSARGEWWPASGASESPGAAYEAARRARSRR